MNLTESELTNLRSLIDFARAEGNNIGSAWEKTAELLYDKLGAMRDIIDRAEEDKRQKFIREHFVLVHIGDKTP